MKAIIMAGGKAQGFGLLHATCPSLWSQ